MNIDALKVASGPAMAVICLDRYLSRKARSWLSIFFGVIALLLLVGAVALKLSGTSLATVFVGPLAIILSLFGKLPGVHIADAGVLTIPLIPGSPYFALLLSSALGPWNGVLLLSLFFYVCLKMLNAYARSKYYAGFVMGERGNLPAVSYDVQAIFARAHVGDIVLSFATHRLGSAIMQRTGITPELFNEYVNTRTDITDYRSVAKVRDIHSIVDLAQLLTEDRSFRAWLDAQTIAVADFLAAAEWVEASESLNRMIERTWGRAAFSRKPGLGEDLAFGGGYKLKHYASEIIVPPAELGQQYGGADVLRLEQSLSRDKGANALLIAPAPHIAEEIIVQFARDIVYHFQHPFLKNKRCYLFDVQYFCKDMDDAGQFEQVLGIILFDAVTAGNIIFVINDLPALFGRAEQLGANIAGVLRPYLSNNSLQIVAISDTAQYHEVLAPQALLSEYFHDIHVSEPENEVLLLKLESIADRLEASYEVFFTVPALREVMRDAERTLVHGLLIDRAEEILEGIPAFLVQHNINIVLPEHIDAYVSQTSHILIGRADKNEQKKLLNIEQLLHASVIGQDIAIKSIADALRRSRAGVRNEKRPVASFFFFGPTGVGKTEVAKTLARVFFGGEDKMLRFDMSEFAEGTALSKLIGSIDGAAGALPPVMREHPYGVLLLDEFEKANSAVHDLFLQILDEGIFHDAQGQVVNCRNAIIIATSNAGAAEIYAHTRNGGKFDEGFTHEVTQTIIAEGHLRPELLNRFDGTILFTPIDESGYRQIAKLMLEKLAARLRGQGIVLVINDALIAAIMEKGIDPVFGARPMQRAIQDIVEKRVAEKILSGKTGPGVPLTFSAEELNS